MLVIWDVKTGIPRKTIFDPHPLGTECMDVSKDGQYIVTISIEVKVKKYKKMEMIRKGMRRIQEGRTLLCGIGWRIKSRSPLRICCLRSRNT